ncbi:hypothetical protein KPL70_005531 [Citrus sinensis]|uniref:uncharacterized protein LOC102615451 n=1 Tax=Citrus sinensis TaxID=2711 RepID=UPI00219EA94B|nr:uncharacterized protein LOC102615451 [Citrus sinensis]KAH9749896.1 hypothetical protein KPL70_005531 [Citrus sinensis]
MDEFKELELQAFDEHSLKLNKSRFLKRRVQLVVSVSIFSLILCYSAGFPQSSNVCFSTFLFSFFTHTLERKYVFLICNGILALLAKTSLVSCSTSTPASAYVAGDDGDDSQRLSASDLLREVEASVDVNNELPPAANGALVAEQEQEESELFAEEVIQEKQKEQVQVTEGTQVSMPEDEEPVVPEEGAKAQAVYEPTTDELNKKIEEFIRKMKEEIRIEAQQQLIAV